MITVCRKMRAIEEAPVEALPVVVVDKRTHLSGGGESMVRTSYFATVETERGAVEVRVLGRYALRPDDQRRCRHSLRACRLRTGLRPCCLITPPTSCTYDAVQTVGLAATDRHELASWVQEIDG